MTQKRFFFFVLGICAIIVGCWYGLREYRYKNTIEEKAFASAPKNIQELIITKGMSLKHISEALFAKKIIVSAEAFQRYIQEQGLSTRLQAGTYTIPNHLTIPEVSKYLIGEILPEEQRFTIPEGSTIDSIAELYEKKGLGTKEDFLSCIQHCIFNDDIEKIIPKPTSHTRYRLEGYLFPDTYFVATHGTTPEKFIGTLLSTFKKRIYDAYNDELGDKKFYDILTMASILEREGSHQDNLALLSGILWKRITHDVQLAADATTVYMKKSREALTYQDLRSSNPYNTRINKGLPPSPISNPGIQAFEAALHPEESTAWYYLHDANGQIHFAATEREHDQNKRLYLSK